MNTVCTTDRLDHAKVSRLVFELGLETMLLRCHHCQQEAHRTSHRRCRTRLRLRQTVTSTRHIIGHIGDDFYRPDDQSSSVSASLKYGIVCHQVLLILNHCHHLEIHWIMLICVYIRHTKCFNCVVVYFVLFSRPSYFYVVFSRFCVYTITEWF